MPRVAKEIHEESDIYDNEEPSTVLVPTQSTDLTLTSSGLTRDQIDLLKRTICKGASDDDLELFINVCNQTKLNPFSRQVYAVQRMDRKLGRNVMTIQISVDGLRLIAQRSREYEGQDGPYWCGKDGVFNEIWIGTDKERFPYAAKVGVYRTGFQKAITAIAKWDSYAATGNDGALMPLWQKMPDLMLAKAAESLALRRAFPAELSGYYSPEEMQQDRIPTLRTNGVDTTAPKDQNAQINFQDMTRNTASSAGRQRFMEEAKLLGYDGPMICTLYNVSKATELPADLTYGTILDTIKEKITNKEIS